MGYNGLVRVVAVLAALGSAVGLLAQRPVADVIGPTGPGPLVCHDRLNFKLAEGSGAELRAGELHSRCGVDLSSVTGYLQWGRVEPLVSALSWDELDLWHARACAVLPPHNRPGHLGLWYRVHLPSPEVATWVRESLEQSPLIEHVYCEPIPVPASAQPLACQPTGDQPPPTPLFTGLQGSFQPAPSGLGIWAAQSVLGGRGQNVRLTMVEIDWFMDHEDVPSLTPNQFLGVVPPGLVWESWHGVAGASCLAAARNEYGLTGIVDEADMRYVAYPNNGGTENGIMLAAANCQPGDVILTVLQFVLGQYGANDWVPIEFLQGAFDATLTATANGRIVVNCAGNGYCSLDDPRFLRRFDRTFRDSGAIMVAATDGGLPQRINFSNWGSRVDANAWGANCVAATTGNLFLGNNDRRQAYSASYGGTSAASTTLCGVVAALQGGARRQLGRSLTTAELRSVLAGYGSAVGASIGLRPDLPAQMRALGILDGLTMQSPDAAVGGQFTLQMEGPAGSAQVAFGSFVTANPGTDLGLNRRLHLDMNVGFTIGFFPLPQGSASWSMSIPNDLSLRGLSLYFQAARLVAGQSTQLTNSCQATVY